MWPPLPSGTPITPLPKEYSRLLAKPGEGAPGIPLKDVKAKHLEGASLDFVHPVDLDFPGLRVVHLDPLVLVVENFLTGEECDELISLSADPEAAMQVASPTFGGALAMTGQRTSTTWFLRYASARNLVERNAALLQLADTDGRRRFEEPQLVRYGPGQQFKWHLDQVPAGEQLDNGGQRLATTLVYLNDMEEDAPGAGATKFRELGVAVEPKKGMALLFFPAFAKPGRIGPEEEEEEGAGHAPSSEKGAQRVKGAKSKKGGKRGKKDVGVAPIPISFEAGKGDERTLHCGSPALFGTKWIAQIWTHAEAYEPKVPPGNAHL